MQDTGQIILQRYGFEKITMQVVHVPVTKGAEGRENKEKTKKQ